MIGALKGLIDAIGDDWVIVDVSGVGYVVHCSAKTLAQLPGPGEAVSLSIETYVREDQIKLFGFAGSEEREWFLLLLGVQGVGTKVALAILSTLGPGDLTSAIALQDKALVARAPGVGPKVAQRIVTELKDKVPAIALAGDGAAPLGAAGQVPAAVADAISALTNLGYAAPRAMDAVQAGLRVEGDKASAQDLIKFGLKELGR
jgi:Holliday junction DNA helicase RuvA